MSDLLEELKRRNVVRVGAAYLVVAWLLIQIVDTIAPLMAMPEWVPGFILILMGVGFPIALVFAWAYEITPDGLKKTEEVNTEVSVTADTGRKIDRMIIGGLAVVVVFLVADRVLGFSGGDSGTARGIDAEAASIAVLPFVNLSSDPEQEFFSDGISEELLNVLAQVSDLRVAARTSSFQFKGDNRDITEIARELNVRHVLEGSVRKDGMTVRITAQLIDADNGFHLWSETYDRGLQNVFAVQDEISSAIVDALRDELGLVADVVARDVSTASPEAHEAYLRGRHLVVQRTRASIEGAIAEFERAVALDPDYALAHAELSLAWHLLKDTQYGDLTRLEVLERSEPAAFRAISLSEGLAEAQAARGFVEWERENFAEALAAFSAALEINPNYSDVHNWSGNILNDDLGRYAESMEATISVAALDPLSIPAVGNLARGYFQRGQFDEAESALDKLASIAPAFPPHIRGESLSHRGRVADGLRQQLESLTLQPTSVRTRNFMAFDFYRLGLLEEVAAINANHPPWVFTSFGLHERAIERAEQQMADDPESPSTVSALGDAFAAAGEFERARPLLETAWQGSRETITRFGIFTPIHAMALAVARRNAGEDDSELVQASVEHARRYAEAGMTEPGTVVDRGLAAWMEGDRERSLALLSTAVEAGAFIEVNLAYLDDMYSDPGFAPIREAFLAWRAAERADFLASVCTENPWAAVWTPLEGTCPTG